MKEYIKFISNNLSESEIDIWFRANNIQTEYCEVFEDFIVGLYYIIDATYLGFNDEESTDTRIVMTEEDIFNHFDWSWKKNIENFKKENIIFEINGQHKVYFKDFFYETYYKQENKEVRKSIPSFFYDLFSEKETDSQINLEMLAEIYKTMYKYLLKD